MEDKSGVIILSGDAKISNEQKDELTMQFVVEENNEETVLELPYIYYLGYNIEMNGKQIQYKESDNGFIMINIPKGCNGLIEIDYKGTKLAKSTFIISSISVIVFGIYILYSKRKNV